VCNPTIDGDEETLLSWYARGGPSGTSSSFNYGTHGSFGADGATARVYADGVEDNSEAVTLDTKAGLST